MLRTTVEQGRLHLTADLRAAENLPRMQIQTKKVPTHLFPVDQKRFPPVDDVVAILDRIASRAFVA
ncbi:MAG: hypothetical protein MUE83_00750 [Tabrizicola sp.]|jgi:hypothetical protein|nr:hypothetical protein [Tabrizicola sp.]